MLFLLHPRRHNIYLQQLFSLTFRCDYVYFVAFIETDKARISAEAIQFA